MDLETATHAYPADVEQVLAMLADEEFLRHKAEALGHRDFAVLDISETGGTTTITTKRTVPVALPDFARKFLSPTNETTQTDVWNAPAADGSRDGVWNIAVAGAPVRMSGTVRLGPAGSTGCTNTIRGQLKVAVPLVGGRLEKMLVEQTGRVIDAEGEFGRRWLAEH